MINNTVIEVLDREHGKKVVEFFKSKGVDTMGYSGTLTKQDGQWDRFYGVIDELFGSYEHGEVIKSGADIITLPEDELDIETFKINARDMETVTINSRDTEFSWPQSNTNSHLLSKAFIIGAKEVVRTIQEDLDELYAERDRMDSMISEKKRALEFYNKKIKEFSGD